MDKLSTEIDRLIRYRDDEAVDHATVTVIPSSTNPRPARCAWSG